MTAQLDVGTESMYGDLVAALAELTELPRGRTANVGSYSYSYADLGDALGAVRPVLAQHGLAVVQPVYGEPGTISVQTVIVHRSGERFESPWLTVAVPQQGGSQAVGSAITYARRYSLMATLGLGTDDDDGAAASTGPARTPSAPVRRPQSEPDAPPSPAGHETVPHDRPSDAQARKLHALLNRLHLSERTEKLAWITVQLGREIESTSEVTRDEVARLIDIAEALHDTDPWAPVDEPDHDEPRTGDYG